MNSFLQLFVAICLKHTTPAPNSIPAVPVVMLKIAKAESGARQFNDEGTIVKHKNTDGTTDYGAYQINSRHIKDAQRLGFDIFQPAGNIEYALYLYKNFNTSPWNSSKVNWSKDDGSDS